MPIGTNTPLPSTRAGERGFTLLELLVAITLLSLVGLIMLGGLRFGRRVWERSAAVAENAESVDAVQRFLGRELAALYPAWQADGPGQGHVAFEGGAHGMRFVGPPPAPAGPAANQRFTLDLSADHALSVAWQPDSNNADLPLARAILLAGVAGLDLAYFGPDASGRNPGWWDSWADRPALPQLIRVRVQFGPHDRRTWPELVVHPEIMVDVACVYDPIYRGCRGR